MKTQKVTVELKEYDQKKVNESFAQIREVLEQYNINVDDVIGLVTSEEKRKVSKQINIRFAELAGPRMNMIAFD